MKAASIFATAILCTSGALAGPLGDKAGLDLCVGEMTSRIGNGLILNRDQLIQRRDGERTFFLNGMQWRNGERTPVGVACTTASNGREILGFEAIDGRYVVRNIDTPALVSATK